jgi:transcriptional regulator with XRE-family HTH domain
VKNAKKKEKPPFARNLILRRKALGWNAHVLAEKARIPYPTLRNIEAGYVDGRRDNQEAIAAALGCSMADLYREDQNQPDSMELAIAGLHSPALPEHLLFFSDVLKRLADADPHHRAAVIATLYNEPSLAGALPASPNHPKRR